MNSQDDKMMSDYIRFVDIWTENASGKKRKKGIDSEDTAKWLKDIPPADTEKLRRGLLQMMTLGHSNLICTVFPGQAVDNLVVKESKVYQFLHSEMNDFNCMHQIRNGQCRVLNHTTLQYNSSFFSVIECGHIKQNERYRIYKIIRNSYTEIAVETECLRALQVANDSVRILYPLLYKSVPLCMSFMFILLECTENVARLSNENQMKKVVMWSVGYARRFTKSGHFDPNSRQYIEHKELLGATQQDFWNYLIKELIV